MGCERVDGTTVEEEESTGEVEESGIRPETRGFRGSREGLRRLIDCKTHGMNHTSYWDELLYDSLERNRSSSMSLILGNVSCGQG